VGPIVYPPFLSPRQGPLRVCGRPHGCRRCLNKGCERWFVPSRPQTLYCCPCCRAIGCQWRRRRAAQRYRASDKGKQTRREQSRRYRQRKRQAQAVPPVPPREGQRQGTNPQNPPGCRCDRPGCYQRFVLSRRSVMQRFCSSPCRQALRRVRQRESRRQERRRQGARPRRRRPRAPPSSDL